MLSTTGREWSCRISSVRQPNEPPNHVGTNHVGATLGYYCGSGAVGVKPFDRLKIGGSTLDVLIDLDQFELGRTALLDWVTRSAQAVIASHQSRGWHH